VLSKPARTLGAKSAAKTGGTSSSFFSPAATELSPSTEFTIVSKLQQNLAGNTELKLGSTDAVGSN
jgi:hypothetical protein